MSEKQYRVPGWVFEDGSPMTVEACPTCGETSLPAGNSCGRSGRLPTFCSSACRQKAYRERQRALRVSTRDGDDAGVTVWRTA